MDKEKDKIMTKVYGYSDDLIEFEGEFTEEASCYESEGLVVMSDGTIFKIKYGDEGIWNIRLCKQGDLFDHIVICEDSDAKIYSDIIYFKEGIKWAYVATEWVRLVNLG